MLGDDARSEATVMKSPLLSTLDDPITLARRTRRPIVLACMLCSAILAPLVDELILGGFFSEGYALTLRELVIYGVWAMLLAAAIGGLVVHLSLADRHTLGPVADTLGLSAIGGVVQCTLVLLAPAVMRAFAAGPLAREALALPVLGGTVGAIVSAPMGLAFGGVFLLAVRPTQAMLAAPTHAAPAQAWRHAARVLVVASALAAVVAYFLEGTYCQSLFLVVLPALDVSLPDGTDLAWTRLLFVPAPLVLAAVAAWLASVWHTWRMTRTIASLRRGDHPRWVLAPSATTPPNAAIVPLREIDRASSFAVYERDADAPYRGVAAGLALVSRDA